MLFTVEVIISLFIGVVTGALLTFIIVRGKLAKGQNKIQKMEMEVLSANHETLETQRAYAELESRIKNQSIPVIPMKINGNKENSKEKATN